MLGVGGYKLVRGVPFYSRGSDSSFVVASVLIRIMIKAAKQHETLKCGSAALMHGHNQNVNVRVKLSYV